MSSRDNLQPTTGPVPTADGRATDYPIQEFHLDHIPPGTTQFGHMSIAPQAAGYPWQLPYLIVTGEQPGPTLVVFAGVHGDEYEGIEAVPRIFHSVTPHDLRGRIVSMPVCNPPAYEAGRRTSPVDELNLARVYPGDPHGTITQRIAYWTGQRLISQADFFIDLHSGSVDADIPTMIGYIHDQGDLGRRSWAAAQAFGAPVAWGHPLPLPPGRTISLATDLGIPALYTETPGGGRASLHSVDVYFQGVRNVMAHLGMLHGEITPTPLTHHLVGDGNLDRIINATHSGQFRTAVELLDPVEEGQPVGQIVDVFGRVQATIKAPHTGIVILLRRRRRVHVGDGLIQITGSAQ